MIDGVRCALARKHPVRRRRASPDGAHTRALPMPAHVATGKVKATVEKGTGQ